MYTNKLYLCHEDYMFKIIALFIITLFARLYTSVGISLACKKNTCMEASLHLKVWWTQTTSLIQDPATEVPVRKVSGPVSVC